MSNIRLFHPENIIENTTSLLSKEHTHYVVNVMRMRRGSNINFFNKDGEWLSEIVFLAVSYTHLTLPTNREV